jgi:hypothetical protein
MNITQNSKPTLVFLLVDASDLQTPQPGKAPDVLISAAGKSFKKAKNQAAEIGDGWYQIDLDASETDSTGPLIVRAAAEGTVEWRDIHYVIVPQSVPQPPSEPGEPTDPEKEPEGGLGDTVLRNGDFVQGKSAWKLYNEGVEGEASWTVSEGVASLNFPAISDNMQFYQTDIAIRKGKAQLSFEARGNAGHTLEVFLHQHYRPYLSLGLAEGVRLTKDWQTYTMTFDVPSTDVNARLRFWFVGHANEGDTFELRNISLKPLLNA